MANFTINSIITVISLVCWIWVVIVVKKILETKRQEIFIMKSLKADLENLRIEFKRLKNN